MFECDNKPNLKTKTSQNGSAVWDVFLFFASNIAQNGAKNLVIVDLCNIFAATMSELQKFIANDNKLLHCGALRVIFFSK